MPWLGGLDIHGFQKKIRDDYESGRHKTVVDKDLPSQVLVRFKNRLLKPQKELENFEA